MCNLLWAIIDSQRVVILNLIVFSPDKRLHGVYSGGEMDSSSAVIITEQHNAGMLSAASMHTHTQTHSNEMRDINTQNGL